MMNIALTMLLAATPLRAQELAFDADALKGVLAGARVLQVKHHDRPAPRQVLDYDARHIAFRLRAAGSGREDGIIYANKSIEILYMDSLLTTLHVNSDPRGWPAAKRLLGAFESLRQDAVEQKRRIVIDYDAIRRQNEAFAWEQARNPRECELFDEIIRLGRPPAGL